MIDGASIKAYFEVFSILRAIYSVIKIMKKMIINNLQKLQEPPYVESMFLDDTETVTTFTQD